MFGWAEAYSYERAFSYTPDDEERDWFEDESPRLGHS